VRHGAVAASAQVALRDVQTRSRVVKRRNMLLGQVHRPVCSPQR
jgi:hypothetical protein